MKPLVAKIKPTKGFSGVVHNGLLILLPLMLFVVRQLGSQFVAVSLFLVVLSKWRMFAVRPRFWAALVRANSVDLIVGVATVVFMFHSETIVLQLVWTVFYAAWLLLLKPRSGIVWVSAQAFVGQLSGLMALFIAWPNAPSILLVLFAGGISCVSARHFFDSFEEPYSRMLSYLWGYFASGLLFILSHWLQYYGPVAQPVVVLTTVGYGMAALYYFDHTGKLSVLLRRQFVFIMLAIVFVLIIFSDWGDKVV
jgi:hypothetical protein